MGKNRDGTHPGETNHAEGQHGDKTHKAFIDQLHSGSRESARESQATDTEGGQRLREDREQRDEAERNSEAKRMRAEVDKGRLDPELPGVGDRINGDPS